MESITGQAFVIEKKPAVTGIVAANPRQARDA